MSKRIESKDHTRQIRSLNALLEVSKAMGAEIKLDNLLQVIISKATEVMDADRSSLFIYDEQKNDLWSRVAEGLEEKEIRFPIGVGIGGDVAKTRKLANIPDAYADPRFNPDFDVQTNFRTRTILCTPMITSEGKLIGVIYVLNKKDGSIFNEEDESLLEALSTHAAVALERAQLVEEHVEKQKIEQALKLAHDIQMGILPKQFPPFPDKDQFEIYASIKPAKEVGGDFYDFFLIDDEHLCVVIGDVSDKGIPAALFMAVTKTLIKATTTPNFSPDEILFKVNNELCQGNESGLFVTIFQGILNINTGELLYANGGHNHPYILNNNGACKALEGTSGIAMGVMENFEYGMKKITLGKNGTLYLYTDGVNEAMDKDGNEFSYERLEDFLKGMKGSSATEVIKGSVETVKRFIGGAPQSDDVTVMALKYLE